MSKQSIIVMVLVLHAFAASSQSSSFLKERLKAIASVPFWYMPRDYDDPRWKTYRVNKSVPLKGVDTTYAGIIRKGKKIIPELMNYLSDSTPTTVPNLCESGNITVGQLAYFLINDIEFIPVPLVTKLEWDVMSHCGGELREGFLDYLRTDGKRFETLYRNYFYSSDRQRYLKEQARR